MPILPAESDIFPANLLEEEYFPEITQYEWWALYTMARREKELMRRLRGMEIRHYGPTIAKRGKTPGGRVITSHVLLFPGYVFLCGDEVDRHRAVATNCVSRCLPVGDPGQLVFDLRQIRRLVQSGVPLTPEAKLQPGARVRIRGGLLAGMEGTVIKRRGGDRLLVAVHFLQQGASVLLEDFEVERL
jgi:transcription antitermination factor NusG